MENRAPYKGSLLSLKRIQRRHLGIPKKLTHCKIKHDLSCSKRERVQLCIRMNF